MTMDIAAANDEPNAGASAAFNLGNMYFRLEMWAEAVEAYAEAAFAGPKPCRCPVLERAIRASFG